MSTQVNTAKEAIEEKLESQIKHAVLKLEALKLKAKAAKAILEIKLIAALLPKTQAIQQKLQELKASGGDRWQEVKAEVESRIAEIEKSVKEFESKANTKAS